MRLILPILLVVVLTGCLEKPAPWKPDGMGGDGLRVGEVDVRAADGGPELVTDVAEVVPDIEPPDISDVDDVQETDGAVVPDLDAVAELDLPPDEDVPEVVPTPLLLRGPSVCPGASGAWQGMAYRATVGWHRNTVMKEK